LALGCLLPFAFILAAIPALEAGGSKCSSVGKMDGCEDYCLRRCLADGFSPHPQRHRLLRLVRRRLRQRPALLSSRPAPDLPSHTRSARPAATRRQWSIGPGRRCLLAAAPPLRGVRVRGITPSRSDATGKVPASVGGEQPPAVLPRKRAFSAAPPLESQAATVPTPRPPPLPHRQRHDRCGSPRDGPLWRHCLRSSASQPHTAGSTSSSPEHLPRWGSSICLEKVWRR
jgi:hypothetical protein